MSGLLRRLTRRRPATADETRSPAPESSEPAGAPAETPAEAGGDRPVPGEEATQVLPATTAQPAVAEPAAEPTAPEPVPQPAPVRDLPAGIDPGELAIAPAASASRGRLRRRLRYLRRVRELLLRDLGGFVFELHRSPGGSAQEGPRRLVESKANRIAALDTEVRGLEARLGQPHEGAVLWEPGIGGLCPECGELHASDAHYCSRCGAPLDAKARAKRDAAAQPTTGAQPAVEPAPASVLWAAGPHPRAQPAEEKEKTDPSAATSQWLAIPRPAAEAAASGPASAETPATGADAAAGNDIPGADNDSPATADGPAAAGDDAPTTAGNDAPGTAGDDAPTTTGDHAPTTAGNDAPGTTGDDAPTAAGDDSPVPEGDDAPAEGGDDAAGAARTRATKPDFEPAPNGRKDEDVPPPLPDPLSSRPEQGS
jgi:zinc-ribbon domain